METHRSEALRIDAPEWFARDDFMEWLNNGKAIATWHTGGPAHDFSDTFVLVDPSLTGEGADSDDMPEDIWDAIVQACKDAGLGKTREHIIVQLANTGA